MQLVTRDGRVPPKRNAQLVERVAGYHESLRSVVAEGGYHKPESSLCLSSDERLHEEVRSRAQESWSDELKYIVVVGIGGSNLGSKAVYEALGGYFDRLRGNRAPRLLFVDTTAPELLAQVEDLLTTQITAPSEVFLVCISKSGGTTETLFNTEVLMACLCKRFGDAARARAAVITQEGSPLWRAAQEQGIAVLGIPTCVGGRYSVLSAVGQLPLMLAGANVAELLRGAREMRDRCLSEAEASPALCSATVLYHQYQEGARIHDTFLFSPHLESLGLWYRQLMGESIGKEHDRSGAVVHAGMTPTVSIGSTDLHSVGQLYLGGPRDRVTTFVTIHQGRADVSMPTNRLFPDVVDMIDNTSARRVLQAILAGTQDAYRANNLPFMELSLADSSEYELGAFLQMKMLEMMYLGELMDLNVFDQPNVEAYKKETRRILQED